MEFSYEKKKKQKKTLKKTAQAWKAKLLYLDLQAGPLSLSLVSFSHKSADVFSDCQVLRWFLLCTWRLESLDGVLLPRWIGLQFWQAVRLTEFVILNVEALRKIVKKMDKTGS